MKSLVTFNQLYEPQQGSVALGQVGLAVKTDKKSYNNAVA